MKDNQKGDEVELLKGKYISKYFSSSTDLLQELNSISKSFCLAKWYSVSLHLPTGKTHSCYHPPAHDIPLDELTVDVNSLHNTSYKKQQRQKMLAGERPTECNFCWAIEDQGNVSDRAYRSFDVYEPGLIEKSLNDSNPKPRYLEVNFNQACNFKCSYCSPHLSTEWYKEIKDYGSYNLSNTKHNDLHWVENLKIDNGPDNPYTKAFWKWFPEVYPTLKTFRMTGGEPLMDKNTFFVFDYVKNNPNKNLHLSITSNCSPPKGQWSKFLQSLKQVEPSIDHFMLYCSLDSWGKQAEYIRYGLDFNILYKNITDYLTVGKKHSLTFIITANILSLPRWLEYIKQIHELRKIFNKDRQLIWFDTPMLHDPKWMSMKLANAEMLSPLLESIKYMEENRETSNNRFKGFKDFEVDKVKRLYSWANTKLNTQDDILAKKNFDLFFAQHDNRRNTNINDCFPELTNFIQECRILNE